MTQTVISPQLKLQSLIYFYSLINDNNRWIWEVLQEHFNEV